MFSASYTAGASIDVSAVIDDHVGLFGALAKEKVEIKAALINSIAGGRVVCGVCACTVQ